MVFCQLRGQKPRHQRLAVYVKKAIFNGEEIANNKIYYNDIIAGGELVFEMGKMPIK